jgi:hypothetical protein
MSRLRLIRFQTDGDDVFFPGKPTEWRSSRSPSQWHFFLGGAELARNGSNPEVRIERRFIVG